MAVLFRETGIQELLSLPLFHNVSYSASADELPEDTVQSSPWISRSTTLVLTAKTQARHVVAFLLLLTDIPRES